MYRAIGKDLNYLTESATYRKISRTYNDRGDEITSITEYSIKCYVEQLDQTDEFRSPGILKLGTYRAYLTKKYADSIGSISVGDELEYAGKTFRITQIYPTTIRGTILYYELVLKEI